MQHALCLSARRLCGLGVGGLDDSVCVGCRYAAVLMMRASLIAQGPIDPNLFLFSDCFCLLHHALPTVFTHCAN